MQTQTVDAVFREGMRLLLDKDIAGWIALFAEDAVIEFPFAPDGWPTRLDGRDAIADYMRHYPDHIDLREFPEVRVHHTTDPRTAVIEMRAVGRVVETGAPYDMSYVAVVTVDDGLITSYRDYWNPHKLAGPATDFTRSAR